MPRTIGWCSLRLVAGLAALVLATGTRVAMAEDAAPAARDPAVLRAELEAEDAAVERDLAELRRGAAETDERTADRIRRLERLQRIHAALAAALGRAEELAVESASPALDADAATLARDALGAEPPFTLLELDASRDALVQRTSERERAEQTLEDAAQSLDAARAALAHAESTRRLAREQAEAAESPADATALQHALAVGELEARIARALVRQRQIERDDADAALELATRREERWRETIDFVRSRLEPSDAALESALASLAERASGLERRGARAKRELAAAEERLAGVQRRLAGLPAPDPALREQAAARRLEVSLRQRELALAGELSLRVRDAEEDWGRRHRLIVGDVDPSESLEWTERARRNLDEAQRQTRIRFGRLEDLRAEAVALAGRRAALAASAPEARWIDLQIDAQDRLVALAQEDLASLEEARRLEARLLEELLAGRRPFDVAGRLGSGWARVRDVWNTEVATSEDSPITVGKIATALCVFVLGYWLARVFASGLGHRLFRRLGLEEGAAHAFQSLAFYALLVLVFVVSLRVVNIPLTALAFVGGALAIGVGFGSQNVVGNFISGVILLAERPIKIGDLVEVGGIYGTVERIGLRSTRVLTGDNIHVIVPNASFLESNVVNWTHTDERVRISVQVGVAYGSPTREVERIVYRVLAEHPRVEKIPEPIVLFKNFGDNSLEFEARFWIRMRRLLDRLSVESDVRFRVDDLFREAGITIAFPQRDVHLDASAPIEVRVVGTHGDLRPVDSPSGEGPAA